MDETRKSTRNNSRYDNANLNFPAGTPSEEILESILRDLILETEEKINDGHLGSLKVSDSSYLHELVITISGGLMYFPFPLLHLWVFTQLQFALL